MKTYSLFCLLAALISPLTVTAQSLEKLKEVLTFHASFDKDFDADFSLGEKTFSVRQGQEIVPVAASEDVKLDAESGRYGGALHFTRKSRVRPQIKGEGVLGYNDKDWNATVSVWLRLDPDKDLEPGYCDPVQIVGDGSKNGFIFLEWSKDETPRFFRYAIRPLFHIWNPDNISWADMPFEKRPMVQVAQAPFSRETWTHVVFSLENINRKDAKSAGRLWLNGNLQGTIENRDLTFGWNPDAVLLVLGASYVGHLDDLSVFNRALTDAEVKQLHALKNGVSDLYR